jgi:hypothetical protein
MSLVFPQGLSLAEALARSNTLVLARVLGSAGDGRILQVRVDRVLRGAARSGENLEIRPAGYALGLRVAAALAAGAPAPSYAQPALREPAPEAAPGRDYVFLLAGPSSPGVHEEAVLHGRLPSSRLDEVLSLCGSPPPPEAGPARP